MKTWNTCDGCARRIDENGKYTSYDEDGNMYCRTCTREMSLPCHSCGEVFPSWDMFYVLTHDAAVCPKCYTTTEED